MSSSDEEVGLFPIDRGEAKKAISDLIKKEGLTTLTSSKIRAYLKSRFNEDFDNFRKDVDNLTKQAIEEMDNAEDKTIGKESVSEELSTKKDYGGGSDSDDTSDPGVVDDMRSPRKKKSSKRKATESGNGDEQDEDENMDLMTAVKHRRRAAANRAQQAFRKSAGTVKAGTFLNIFVIKSKWEKKDPTKVKDNSGKFGRMTKLCLLSEELQIIYCILVYLRYVNHLQEIGFLQMVMRVTVTKSHFFSKISKRMRSKSPVPADISHSERFKDYDDKENRFRRPTTPESLPNTPHRFGTFLDRISRKKTKKDGKVEAHDKSVDCGSECDGHTQQIHFSSPRPAVSENDLRHVTLKRGTEITSTPLVGATFFMSEDNLASTDCGVSPYRTPSYVRISCALNGYMRSPMSTGGSPVKTMAKSLVERRLWQFQIRSPESQKSTPRLPVENNSSPYQMGKSFSTPSPVKALIGQFDKLTLCSVNKDEEDKLAKENINPHNIIVDQPINCTLIPGNVESVNNIRGSAHIMPDETLWNVKVESLPETAADCIRMAAGKAQLLVGKKLTKFDELVKKNIKPVMNDPQPATVDDLEGYWALVEIELADINMCFEKVELWRSSGWSLDDKVVNQTPSKSVGLNNNVEKNVPKPIKTVAPLRRPNSEKQVSFKPQLFILKLNVIVVFILLGGCRSFSVFSQFSFYFHSIPNAVQSSKYFPSLSMTFCHLSGNFRIPLGTTRYCSINTHERGEQGRVDDLWSLLYMLAEMRGPLPWANTREKKDVLEIKRKTDDDVLLENSPVELIKFAQHVNTLTYYTRPDYTLLHSLLVQIMDAGGFKFTDPYDWETKKKRQVFKDNFTEKNSRLNSSCMHYVPDKENTTTMQSLEMQNHITVGIKKYRSKSSS
uniref:DEK_C domain-containing protein n=1 Tax=Heterorhabditis bacteriophora TaxID=37862 RepID=A0A1I7XB93_HETBA